MASDDRITHGILGDIEPLPAARDHKDGHVDKDEHVELEDDDPEANQSMTAGAHQNPPSHAGSRDVGDGGGVGAETGGTRNYRQGTGATGGDLGNRPE
jgi:hypothetical protein